MKYKVYVDDNYHYMDKDHRYTLGEFDTLDAAVAACKQIVDEYLEQCRERADCPTAFGLFLSYTMFGEDPWIAGDSAGEFCAWDYAKERAAELCRTRPTEKDASSG